MRLTAILCLLLVLSACATARESTLRVSDNVHYEVGESYKKVRGYMAWKRAPQPVVEQEIPQSYCYKLQTDIVCYEQPIPGKDNTLVGYQEPIVTRTLVPAKSVGAKEDSDMPILPRHVWTEKTQTFPYFTVNASNDPRPSSTATIGGGTGMSGGMSSTTSAEAAGSPVFVGSAPKIKGVGEEATAKSTVSAAPPKKSSPAKATPVVSSSAYTPKDLIPSF